MSLTYKQRAFVEHFLGVAQWNATEAARRAGYKHPNKQGPRLLVNVGIQRHIADRLHEMGATADELVCRWLVRMRADISPFVSKRGLDVQAMREAGLGHLIKGVRRSGSVTNVELRDPDKAEELLARPLGMFVERRILASDPDRPVRVDVNISGLTNEQLDTLAELARRVQAD